MNTLIAQITNPALPASVGDASTPVKAGDGLALYIGVLWKTALIIGGLAVLMYLIIASISWITAGGDKDKVSKAKEQITQAIIGLLVLISVAVISTIISGVIGFDLLTPVFRSLL